ncbi:hypothetical protein Acor_75300 [Acrocarpospora corrugata]|uniref:Uncharacterized protein n=1 Tax=Acrocarpospora corrugata TaxID=35763 RepID=A0A5M3WBP6_9ACTN|nr:hypothetical protein Acor_75300 [Acrocarpospora corrugata]
MRGTDEALERAALSMMSLHMALVMDADDIIGLLARGEEPRAIGGRPGRRCDVAGQRRVSTVQARAPIIGSPRPWRRRGTITRCMTTRCEMTWPAVVPDRTTGTVVHGTRAMEVRA